MIHAGKPESLGGEIMCDQLHNGFVQQGIDEPYRKERYVIYFVCQIMDPTRQRHTSTINNIGNFQNMHLKFELQ